MLSNERKHLLLIDDDEDDFFILKDVIGTYFESVSISYFSGCDQLNKTVFDGIDIVLLDINMPRINGFECLGLIRNEYGLTKVPVIMYSNSFATRDIKSAYEKGANLFVNKPTSFEKIRQAISDILSIDWTTIEEVTEQYHNSHTVLKY
ncbi:MAG: response regulator [Flavisolibacter sp.]